LFCDSGCELLHAFGFVVDWRNGAFRAASNEHADACDE
jgi:hypothetical protein